MKDLVLAIIMLLCALIDGIWTYAVWTAAYLYGADMGAVITLTLFSAVGGLVCLCGGVAFLIEGLK